MAQDWYYKLLGEETGPLTFRSLRELAADGHLTDQDEIRTSTSSWRLASEVPELFQPGDVVEPELTTGYDLDMLLTPSAAPTRLSDKRKALLAAKAAANAPPPQWFYKVLGQELGPVTDVEIIEQITAGSLHGDDVVRSGSQGRWQELQSTPQFAAAVIAARPQPEWYCRVLGQELGPMTFEELEAMAQSGSLHADDDVRHGSKAWIKADRTRGLKFTKAEVVESSHDRTATYVPFGDDAKRKEWYYEILGQEMGPISFHELLKAVADGSLAFEDQARKGKTGAWSAVMDVPGLVTTDAKSAYLAAKLEASRPKPAPAAPTVTSSPAATPPQSATRSVAPSLPESRPVTPAASSASESSSAGQVSGSGAGSYGSGLGGMSAPSRPAYTPPPSFKAPRKSSSSSGGGLAESLKSLANPKVLMAVGALVVAGLLIAATQFGFSFGVPGKSEYYKVKAIWIKVRAAHQANDMTRYRDDLQKEVASLQKVVEGKSPGSTRRLVQLMLFATRDDLPKIINGSDDAAVRIKNMEIQMKEAAILAGDSNPAPAAAPPTSTPKK